MEMNEQAFRRAAVGGFNREDVLNYIEHAARTASGRIAALEKENSALKSGKEAAETSAREAEERASALERENGARFGELEAEGAARAVELAEKVRLLGEVREALESERVERQCLQAELDHLREKMGRVESGAAAYAELRDRTGTIELEAHQRAMLIEQAAEQKAEEIRARAEEDAKKLRSEAERFAAGVQAGYERARAELGAALDRAAGGLDGVRRSLDGVGAELAAHDAAMQVLQEAGKRPPERSKFPQPLPLGGEE